jgi:hypothetical protein
VGDGRARGAVALAHDVLARLGDGAQDRVADRVAVGVVDRLEAVEVEDHQRATLDLAGEHVVEGAAVAQAGERVAHAVL